ncbi:MAG: HYR domain-containing protein [Nitrosopumilus sp.]|nr:HYR domain-containing protein [Nitrosopumilus sp.]
MNGVMVAVAAFVAVLSGASLAHADTIPLTDPADVVVEAEGVFTRIDLEEPGHDPSLDLEFTSSAPEQYHVGTTKVVWLARDADGNMGLATTIVTVQDTTPPWFLGDPPEYVEYRIPPGKKKLPIQFDVPGAADLADLAVDVSSSHKPGSKFPRGNTTVTFTAVDDSGNKAVLERVVAVKRLEVENLVLTRTHDKIRAEWDQFGNHTSYGVFITEAGSKKKIEDATTGSTVYTFSNLEPGTDYEVAVYLHEDRRIKASSTVSTLDAPFLRFYGFEDKKILAEHRDSHNRPIEIPDSVNAFSDTVGMPAPSMYFNSSNARYLLDHHSYPRTAKIIFDDLPDLRGMNVYLGFDYKMDKPRSIFDIHFTDTWHRPDREGRVTALTSEWQRFSLDVSNVAHANNSVELFIYLPYRTFDIDQNTLYIDNLYIGTVIPFDGYQGGSAGSK